VPLGQWRLDARLWGEHVGIAVLGKRADIRHEPMRSCNRELVGDRAIKDPLACLDRHVPILIDGKLPFWIRLHVRSKIDHVGTAQQLSTDR
jgi:hypothetical protein